MCNPKSWVKYSSVSLFSHHWDKIVVSFQLVLLSNQACVMTSPFRTTSMRSSFPALSWFELQIAMVVLEGGF